ncbi:hypothetical protein ACJJTC_000299 [Scirpophaga incertulas]
MELRLLSLCLVLFVLGYTQCSEAHSMQKRGTDDNSYDDIMGDEAGDDEAQNDADGGYDAEEENSIPATIQTLPTSYNVTVGRTIRLECRVEPADGAVVQWFRNGQHFFMGRLPMIAVGAERFSIADNSNDLLISEVEPSDSGVYKCSLVQVEPVYIEHTLSVQEAPRIESLTANNNGVVMEGSELLLTCKVAGSPPPQIIWSKNSEEGNKRLQEKDANFTLNGVYIRKIKHDQAGKYICYAINSVGHAQSEIFIKVLHKPRVHVPATVINSDVKVEAVIQCYAHGEPAPTITWFKDGIIVDTFSGKYNVNTQGGHSNLTVVPQSDEDFGTFTCEASNGHGSHRASASLVQRPVVASGERDGRKLAWRVHSRRPLRLLHVQVRPLQDPAGEIKEISLPIPQGKGHEYEVIYELKDLEPAEYEVIIKAKNDKDWSDSSEPIIVDYDAQPMSIQHASVLYSGNSQHSIRPAAHILFSTMFMYLLVRMI